jgi:hypothetical protein
MRSSLFWDVLRRRLVVICRRFGLTLWSHLEGSSSYRRFRTIYQSHHNLSVTSQPISHITTYRSHHNLSVTSEPIGHILSVKQSKKTAWHLKMWPIGCPKTSVNNYQSTPRNIPEGRKFQMCESWVSTSKRTLQCPLYEQSVNAVGLYGKKSLFAPRIMWHALIRCVTKCRVFL